MIAQNRTQSLHKTAGDLKSEVESLSAKITKIEKFGAPSSYALAILGALSALELGPIAFALGAAVPALLVAGLSFYSANKKKQLESEITSLQSEGKLKKNLAEGLRKTVESIHTDDPRKRALAKN